MLLAQGAGAAHHPSERTERKGWDGQERKEKGMKGR